MLLPEKNFFGMAAIFRSAAPLQQLLQHQQVMSCDSCITSRLV